MFVNHVVIVRVCLIVLLSTLTNCKSIERRDVDNKQPHLHLNQVINPSNGNISVEIQKDQEIANHGEKLNRTGTNHRQDFGLQEMQDEGNDRHLSGPERDKRGPIVQINNTLMENFRSKLHEARSKLKEMKFKSPTPTVFVIDPNKSIYNQENPHLIHEDPSRLAHRQILEITHPHIENDRQYENYRRENEFSNDVNLGMNNMDNVPAETIQKNFDPKNTERLQDEGNVNFEKKKGTHNIKLAKKNMNDKSKQVEEKPVNKINLIEEDKYKDENVKQANFNLNEGYFENLLNNSLKDKNKNTFPSDGFEQLVEIREEINKLRSLMQVVKEHQMKEHFSNAFSNQLKPEDKKQLLEFVEKLKQNGQISTETNATSPKQLDNNKFDKNPNTESNESSVLTKDIKNLRLTVLDFMKKLNNEKINAENLEKLEREFVSQQAELENLKTLLERLVPQMVVFNQTNSGIEPDFEERNNEKERLHKEIMSIGDLFDDFPSEEIIVGQAPSNQTKLDELALLENPVKKDESSEDDLDFLKIFQKLTSNPRDVSNDAKSIELKLEKLERDLKDLENLNHRTKQEMLLEKLESDIIKLKAEKKEDKKQNVLNEPQETISSNIAEKVEELQKQIKLMSKPETRDLKDVGSIEKELNKLQEKIDKLSEMRSDFPVFQDHLTPPGEEFGHNLHVPQDEVHSHGPVNHHNHFTSKSYVSTEGGERGHVFQLPFCLQRTNQDYTTPYYYPQHVTYSMPEYPKVIIPHTQQIYPQDYYDKNVYLTPTNSEISNIYDSVYKSNNERELKSHDTPSSHTLYKTSATPVNVPEGPGSFFPKLEDQRQLTKNSPLNPFQLVNGDKKLLPTSSKAVKNSPIEILSKLEEQKRMPVEAKNVEMKKQKLSQEITLLEDTLGVFREKLNSEQQKPGGRSKRSIDGLDNVISKLEGRINYLRNEMAQLPDYKSSLSRDLDQKSARSYGNNPYEGLNYYKPKSDYSVNIKKEEKFDKLFIKLLKFVLHKVGISAPYIFDFLFGSDSYNNDYDYSQGNQYNQYSNGNDVQYGYDDFSNNFSLFGLSGFLPTIFFRLLGKIPQFIRFLQRNVFIKNFLVPGGVILIVNGILAFLVWWFFPSEFNNSSQNSNYISSYLSNYNVQPYYS